MDSATTQNYVEILEKTNQQLGLWTNPYGLAVGVLTILVALLALAATLLAMFYLARQRRDYRKIAKEAFEKFIDEQKGVELNKTREYAKSLLDEIGQKLEKDFSKKKEEIIEYLKEARRSLDISPKAITKSLSYEVTPGFPSTGLTEPQIQSILALLESFGAEQKTINDVERVFRGV